MSVKVIDKSERTEKIKLIIDAINEGYETYSKSSLPDIEHLEDGLLEIEYGKAWEFFNFKKD